MYLHSLSLSAQFGFIAQNSGFAATTATRNELLILVILNFYFENILNEVKKQKKEFKWPLTNGDSQDYECSTGVAVCLTSKNCLDS